MVTKDLGLNTMGNCKKGAQSSYKSLELVDEYNYYLLVKCN